MPDPAMRAIEMLRIEPIELTRGKRPTLNSCILQILEHSTDDVLTH